MGKEKDPGPPDRELTDEEARKLLEQVIKKPEDNNNND
jgi:hypothetical protein